MDEQRIREIVAEIVTEQLQKQKPQCVTMKIDEAAAYLGISDDVIRKQCQLPKDNPLRIPHSRGGVQYLFRKETLDAWMAEQEGFKPRQAEVIQLQRPKDEKLKLIETITESLAKLVQ